VSCVMANRAVVVVVAVALWSRCRMAQWWWPHHGRVITLLHCVVVAMVIVVVIVCCYGRGRGCTRTVVAVMVNKMSKNSNKVNTYLRITQVSHQQPVDSRLKPLGGRS
jgi:hypothetical protein